MQLCVRNVVASLRSRLGMSFVVLALTLGVAGLTRESFAQRGGGMRAMGMGADMASGGMIGRRSIEAYAKMLAMTDEQKESANLLWEGYQKQYKGSAEAMEEQIQSMSEKARDTGDFSVFRTEMPKLSMDHAKKVQDLEKSFMDDLKATLSASQTDQWDKIDRHRRREKSLRFGFYSGAGVDLINAVDRAKADPGSKEFAEVMGQYESTLDAKLVEYERKGKDMEKDAMDNAKDGNFQKQMEMLTQISTYGKDIRDINRDYTRRLLPLMGEETAAKFQDEVNRRSYPRVYREAHILKQLKAAAGLEGISADQKGEVKLLGDQYTKDATKLNVAWAKAIDEGEEKAGGSINMMMRNFGQEGGNEALKTAREERKVLDDKAKEKLETIIGKDKFAELPKRKPRDENPWDIFGGGENEDEE